MNALEFKKVSFSYDNREEDILRNLNLKVPKGDYLLVLGPNGGGKSTFLKLIVGLIKPSSGEIIRSGKNDSSQLQGIGYLPQNTNLNPNFPVTVSDVVLMGRPRKEKRIWLSCKKDREHAEEILDQVNMADFRKQRMGTLSGGQRQRVLIARALMTEPELLVLDEPTASIDAAAKAGFFELLEKLHQKITIIMVSHDLSIIPAGANSVACINQTIHHHDGPQITEEMLAMTYGCTSAGNCPVELVAHGVPHRVLSSHIKVQTHE